LVRYGGAGGEVDPSREGSHGSEAKTNQKTHNIKARLSRRTAHAVEKERKNIIKLTKAARTATIGHLVGFALRHG
jgi:hypothetical protein